MNLEAKDVTAIGQGFGVRCKTAWLDAAEIFDSWRVIPRAILFLYGYWMVQVTDRIISWYEKLPAAERSTQVTAVITVIIPGIFGLACWVFKIYSSGGRKWDGSSSTDPDAK